MVFIKSQEYVNPFGKKSKNIICLEGQSDYRMSLNPETNKFDVTIVMGDYEKFIFTASSEDEVDKVMQNIYNHHATKEPHLIYDVEAFMIPEIENETTLEKLEELVVSILEFHGYKNVVDAWETKLNEEVDIELEEGHTSPMVVNESGELCVGTVEYIEQPTTQSITSHEHNHVTCNTAQKYVHYQ